MPEIKFDTEDYYDDETIQDMIESETRSYIRDYVNCMMQKNKYWVPDFIVLTAQRIVEDTMTERMPKYKQQIADRVQDVAEHLEDYQIRYSDKFKEILDECIEEYRPLIRNKVNDVCAEKIDADYLIDCVCDEFYKTLSKMLTDD